MCCNLKKIIIKYSFILFAFLTVIDASVAAEAPPFFDARDKENIPPVAFKMNAQVEGDSIQEEEAPAAGQENTDCCVTLQEFGLSRREALSVHLKNNALFIEMRKTERPSPDSPSKFQKTSSQKADSEFEIDLTALSPAKMSDFRAEGGDLFALEREIRELKTEHPSPIRNTTLFPRSDDHVFSPSVRKTLSRPQLQVARKEGVVRKLFPIAYQAPFEEETEEERLARKEAQERDFLEAERRRGKIPENLHEEIQKEFEIWQDYLNYIEMRKANCLAGDGNKITRSDIEEAFKKFVAPKLVYIEVNGYHVYFTLKTLDFDRENDEGDTNQQIMKKGYCPIGVDGKPMHYHHLTHYDLLTHQKPSLIVLITDNHHTTHSGFLHFTRTTYLHLPRKPVDRNLFIGERKNFNRTIVSLYG